MMNLYTRMGKTTERLIKQYGMEYVLKRKGKFYVDKKGQEIIEPDMVLKAVGVKTQFAINEVDNSLVLTSDIKFIAHAKSNIQQGDIIIIDNRNHRVIAVKEIKPQRQTICFIAQLRA
ncbi:MAG TPA: hypothetical protein ACHBX6_02270 [Arsenophonus nasoniae]|uniref:hypothetical protein n=2 Tax=Morganellaceae TaxID=1903414 RepID=UPI001CDB5031|nr:hypothetical protein [Arsenophonus apicola]UBX30021.1 hypothetical protein LDL57_05190 [Arsenophonus apicola]UBX30229.1 hypothetical protein LDL57_06400 [Arsenophonus apicola]UBX30806.1 hypothetical protein LDL57_16735 [Arsenophonus apicola]